MVQESSSTVVFNSFIHLQEWYNDAAKDEKSTSATSNLEVTSEPANDEVETNETPPTLAPPLPPHYLPSLFLPPPPSFILTPPVALKTPAPSLLPSSVKPEDYSVPEQTSTPRSRSSSFHTASDGEPTSPWWEMDPSSDADNEHPPPSGPTQSGEQSDVRFSFPLIFSSRKVSFVVSYHLGIQGNLGCY